MLRTIIAECLGTAVLLATVVGSGMMGESLSGGNTALALLANALATGAILFVLINIFAPLSGAHFNPVVTVAMWWTKRLATSSVAPYMLAQIFGAMLGVVLAHAMFDQSLVQVSVKMRWGVGQWVAEGVATFGLLLTIFGLLRHKPDVIPQAVALYIFGAYWFTASTSFANPAVTIARSLTDTFSGIAPSCVLAFIAAQIAGGLAAIIAGKFLYGTEQ
jgi:glycerol uptake facilitator-like aquaporin